MFCPNCGTEIVSGAKFCPNCGTPSGQYSTEKENAKAADDATFRQPVYGNTYFKPLKTDRTLLAYILLSLVTCRIYSYIFLYQIIEDTNVVCAGDGEETPSLVMFIVLSIVTCGIYAWIFYYKFGNRLAANAPRYGLNFQENGTTILLWMLVGSFIIVGPILAWYFIIKNMNALCSAYNDYNMTH